MAATISSIFLLVLSVLAHWTPILVAGDEASDCVADLATLTTAVSNADAGVTSANAAVTAANNALATAQQAKVTAQQALDARTTICSFTCPAGFTKVPGVQKCIKIVNENIDWDIARLRCPAVQAGSYLASIDSAAENTFFQSHFAANTAAAGAPSRGYWLGGRRATESCNSPMEYKTATLGSRFLLPFVDLHGGTAFSCGAGYPLEHCLELIRDGTVYKMNDITCGPTANRPICQYP